MSWRHTVGKFGLGLCNPRGTRLRAWSNTRKMIIANTFFYKHFHNLFTYISSGKHPTQTQIDYILIDRARRYQVVDSYASNVPDFESDHQAAHVKMDLEATTKRKRRRKQPHRGTRSHPPADDPFFQ
eukprot:2619478-Pyramimonas_sp.AAC.1